MSINDITLTDGNEMDKYDCVKTWKTLSHPDYCCPFCSHGETIKLKIFSQYRGNLMQSYFHVYLECSENCMKFGIFEQSFCDGLDMGKILLEAMEVFSRLTLFTKDRTEFIIV